MPIVAMPDGTRVSFPDNMPPDQVRAFITKKFPNDPHVQGGTDKGAVVSGLHGVVDAATFGLFDKAAPYIGAALTGESVDQARGEISGNEAATNEAHPIAHAIGEVGGAVAGGGALERGAVSLATKVAPRAVQAAARALALQKGQLVRNTGRLAAQGAASGAGYGAVAGAVQGSDDGAGSAATGAVEGGAMGGAGGAVLGPAGGAAVKAGSVVARSFGNSSTKAIAALAKKFDMAPNDLEAAYRNYEADAGHPPSLAEITDLKNRGELQRLASRNPVVGAAAETARQKAASQLPSYLSAKAAATVGHPQDVSDLVQARDAKADATMKPIRGQLIGLSPDEAEMVMGEIVPNAGIKGPIRKQIAEELDGGTLSLHSADIIRRNLNRQAFAKPGEGYDQLADALNTVARSASPEYGGMLDAYAADSRYIDSFMHGTTGKTVGQTSDSALIKSLQTPEGEQGYQAGLATRIHDQSFKSETSAARTADQLSQDAALRYNASKVFGPQQSGPLPRNSVTAPLEAAARAKGKGLENLSVISPGTPRPPGDGNVGTLHAGLAAVSGIKGAVYHSLQAVTHGLKLSEPVQRRLGDMLTDPRQSRQAINYLRAQGVRDHDLRVLMTRVAKATARPGGMAGAYLEGQLK